MHIQAEKGRRPQHLLKLKRAVFRAGQFREFSRKILGEI